MGEAHKVPLVKPIIGLLGKTKEDLKRTEEKLVTFFGEIIKKSQVFLFSHTNYYTKEMGSDLLREFLVFENLKKPEEVVNWKLLTNELEAELGGSKKNKRRVNIDPGYLAPGKLVLASTKDHEHRVYLSQGIYAEITLRIRKGKFKTWSWTYLDYAENIAFFNQAYADYINELAKSK